MITRRAKLWHGISKDNMDYRIDWIRLARSQKIGPITFFDLLAIHGHPTEALAIVLELANKNNSSFFSPSRKEIENEIKEVDRIGASIVLPYDFNYPEILLAIPDPPLVLTIRGKLLNSKPSGFSVWRPAIAIVGARNASANGCYIAKRLATDLGRSGYNIVSGLARGIDKFIQKRIQSYMSRCMRRALL